MEHKIKSIIQKLDNGKIQFADARITINDSESFYFDDGFLRGFSNNKESISVGVRVMIRGCWGFAGSDDLSDASIDCMIKTAIDNAESGALFKNEVESFPALPATKAEYIFTPEIDPFKMDKEEKLDYLGKLATAIKPQGKIVYSMLVAVFKREEKFYANSEGSYSHTVYYNTMPLMQVLASDGQQNQSRTWPGDMSGGRAGFERFYHYDFENNTERIIKEATDLLTAPTVSEKKADIIIGGGHLALQLHESVGHATEADRIFGMEISYAARPLSNQRCWANSNTARRW